MVYPIHIPLNHYKIPYKLPDGFAIGWSIQDKLFITIVVAGQWTSCHCGCHPLVDPEKMTCCDWLHRKTWQSLDINLPQEVLKIARNHTMLVIVICQIPIFMDKSLGNQPFSRFRVGSLYLFLWISHGFPMASQGRLALRGEGAAPADGSGRIDGGARCRAAVAESMIDDLVGSLQHEFDFPQYLGWRSNLTFIFFRGVETTD